MRTRLSIPFRGAANVTTRQDQPPGTVPLASIRNMSVYTGEDDTASAGKRPPLEDIFGLALADSPVQGVVSMSRSSFTAGFSFGDCEPIGDGQSVVSAGLAGNLFSLDEIPSLARMFTVDVTADGGTQTLASVVSVSARGNRIVCAVNFATSGNDKAIVACFNHQGDPIWQETVEEASVDRFVNSVAISPDGNLVAVTTNQYVQVRLMVDGSVSGTSNNVDGWSNECTDAQWTSAGNLLVLFNGSAVAGIAYNGTTINSEHFRSGVAVFEIEENALSRGTIGVVLPATDPYQEAASSGGAPVRHGYMRIAESSGQYPRGCYPTCLAVGPNDEFVIGRENQGYGPDWNPGTATIFPGAGYVSVAKYSAEGLLIWEADAFSNRDPYAPWGPIWYNDINNATILAVAIDSEGTVYAAGRIGIDGNSVRKLHSVDGVLLQSFDSGATVRGLLVDESDGNLWVAMDRNPDWTGSGGAYAHLLKLRTADMTVIEAWDLGENVSGLCVSRASGKELVYGTDMVS